MKLPSPDRLKRGRAAVIDCTMEDCDICLHVCGFLAISRDEDGRPYSDTERCVGCGGCAAICPGMDIVLVKDRGDGGFEFTIPFDGELPELDDTVELTPPGEDVPIKARVIQAIPKRPNAVSALVRAAAQWEPNRN